MSRNLESSPQAGGASAEPLPQMQSEPSLPFKVQHQDGVGLESQLSPAPRFMAERYKPAGKLTGKIALITGGDSGIGRAIAVLYAREGADVAISYLPEEQGDADATCRFIKGLGQSCEMIPGDLTDAQYCENLVAQTVARFGKLDILVSNAALADYSATKGAINSFTKALAQNLVKRGIRVNAVAPGPVWTPLNPADAGLSAKEVAHFGESNPMGRPSQPEELAPAYFILLRTPTLHTSPV